MKHGDFYKHLDGQEYVFNCIALPFQDPNLSKRDRERMLHTHDARLHDKVEWLNVYESGGATFIDSDVPHVLYQKKKDFEDDTDFVYAREVDNFFGQTLEGKPLRKTIDLLTKSMKELKATDVHFTAENVLKTQNLTSVVSVYDNIKPAHKVLEELKEWAENNHGEMFKKIHSLEKDMSWNPKID